jgi:putative ABC transport system permease protein
VAEVGIRKVLGAETRQMVLMLLASISRPVIVASLIAWPLAYLVASVYVGAFLEPVALTPVPFLLVVGLVIANATLRRCLRARALADPPTSLQRAARRAAFQSHSIFPLARRQMLGQPNSSQ